MIATLQNQFILFFKIFFSLLAIATLQNHFIFDFLLLFSHLWRLKPSKITSFSIFLNIWFRQEKKRLDDHRRSQDEGPKCRGSGWGRRSGGRRKGRRVGGWLSGFFLRQQRRSNCSFVVAAEAAFLLSLPLSLFWHRLPLPAPLAVTTILERNVV
jgi:hypothetical protein